MLRALVISVLVLAVVSCGHAEARPEATNPRPSRPHDFRTAKARLNEDVYTTAIAREDVYCGCRYEEDRSIEPSSCGYTPSERERERAFRMEWDHVMPFARFARGNACTAEARPRGRSRREHCVAVSPELRDMEGDMHNLLPSLGQLNAMREDYDLAEIPGEARVGGCDFEVDPARRTVEPRPEARGELARAYLYMHVTYALPLTSAERSRYLAWHRSDPPTAWERARNTRIAALQGNENPFVSGR